MAVGLYSGVSGLALGIGLYRNVSGLWGGSSGLIDGFGGADPYAGASLYLNFLDPVLDSRITFSRGTNATLIDSTGKLTYAPNNLVVRSEEFDSASWNKFNGGVAIAPSVTANAGVAPDGTTTADRIQFALNGGTTSTDRSLLSQSVTIATSVTYVFSIWVRSLTGTVSMGIGCDNVAGNTPITVTTSWQRFTLSGTASGTAGVVLLQLRGGQTPVQANAADVLVWGAQLEAVTYQTTPSTYVATTASAYYGPRFDYDPVTLAPRGLLIEEARTNLVLRSEEFNDAAWGVAGVAVTANTTTAPSGVTAADTITGNSGANAVIFSAAGTPASAASYTASCYVKAGSAAWIVLSLWQGSGTNGVNAWFNLQTGAVGSNNVTAGYAFTSATSTNVGNGWYRITVTGTVPAVTIFWSLRMVDGDNAFVYTNTVGDTTFVWGAQLELGAFATSYIPTIASTVTRNADVATMTGTNFSSWYNQSEGTFVVDASMLALNTVSTQELLALDDSGVNNLISLRANNTAGSTSATATAGGVSQGFLDISGTVAGVPQKVAYGIKLNDAALVRNGGTVITDTTYAVPTGQNRMAIGARLTAFAFLNGHFRVIAYFNTRLPNAQLQTLTAPSLATTLSLDFTSGSYNVGF